MIDVHSDDVQPYPRGESTILATTTPAEAL
jgi:hypothetical protein